MPTRRFRVHGVLVETEHEDPSWPLAPEGADAGWSLQVTTDAHELRDEGVVRSGDVQWAWTGLGGPRSEVHLSGGPEPGSGGVYGIHWSERQMVVRHWPPRPGAERDILDIVAAWLLPRIARHERGCLSLHAATVADEGAGLVLCGASGSGKSTLTVALLQRGWSLVTDEPSLVEWRDGLPSVWPGPQRVRLVRDSAALERPWAGRWEVGDKVAVAPLSLPDAPETPVRAIVVLGGRLGADEPMRVRRLDPTEAVAVLMAQRFTGGMVAQEARTDFPLVARLAGEVPVMEARLPDDEAALPAAVSELLAAVS